MFKQFNVTCYQQRHCAPVFHHRQRATWPPPPRFHLHWWPPRSTPSCYSDVELRSDCRLRHWPMVDLHRRRRCPQSSLQRCSSQLHRRSAVRHRGCPANVTRSFLQSSTMPKTTTSMTTRRPRRRPSSTVPAR